MIVLTFLMTYWFELLMGIIILGAIGTSIYKFSKLPVDTRYSKIRAWMLYAVSEAEKEWGSGTGAIKIGKVYDMMVAKFPWVSFFMSEKTFNELVDHALNEMRELLENSKKVAVAINGEAPIPMVTTIAGEVSVEVK